MPLTIDQFRSIADSTAFASRDIAVRGAGKNATARLGNFVFSQGKAVNDATMAAFRAAMEKEYGVFGANAFDTTLGTRSAMHKSLRAMDVKQTLSNLAQMSRNRFVAEVNRQIETSPMMLDLSTEDRNKVRNEIGKNIVKDIDLASCRTATDVSLAAQKRIAVAIEAVSQEFSGLDSAGIGPRQHVESGEAASNEATGLRNLNTVFGRGETSIADLIKRGLAGEGMRVNRSETNPVILEKLKSNGVEPGFIYRNDWSADDTRGLMADIGSEESLRALEELKRNNQAFADKCVGKPLREQIMLAGRAHPAGIAAVSEFAIQDAAQTLVTGGGHVASGYVFKALAEGLKAQFGEKDLAVLANGTANRSLVKEAKLYLFSQIRDGVMNVDPKDDFYMMSPIFKHFSDRAIVKLDYNESDKFSKGDSAHAGTFMRPERVAVGRKMGQIYRFQTRATADKISAGAVTEALANDLTRIAGVPSQELEIVRGEYSDGHPKLMLAAKFANGYKDMEAGFLKDGRIVAPGSQKLESLGKYKAFFLLTADRDGVGKRGQNKGFVNGKFFAIDPGHSLEGNGKYLEIADDFSFKDTYGRSSKPRFNNFSVFDDDTRFAKLTGLVQLRETARSGAFDKLFADYKAAFNPEAPDLSDAEKALRTKICADIDAKKIEFDTQLRRLLDIGGMQLELYDRLAADGPAMQEKAINTLSHLEMLTSPTTWVSKHGKVALNHLEVRPETRIPWRAGVDGDNIVFHCDKPLDGSLVSLIETITRGTGANYTYDESGVSRIVVPKADADRFFAAISEENVQKLTHPEEYSARKTGGDPLKTARDYKPITFSPVPPPGKQLTADRLPDFIDFPDLEGRIVRFPKIHYQQLATVNFDPTAPRSVGQLRAFLEARVRRGEEILNAVRDGDVYRFEPSTDNIVCLTHALHALALRQGQYMYRGAFSVADPDGNLARWLDRADGLYARASTHAQPYHSMMVDGHRNEARGYDVPEGMRGLLNGMRTFHYFTIPDTDHLEDAGGSGPRRRLYLKCETFGVFVNKISSANAKASITPDMKTRGYQVGDVIESFAHGMSLLNSFWTPKEAPGIQKENLLEAQKRVIDDAERNLVGAGLHELAEKLISRGVRDGAGIRLLLENVGDIYENMMPENPAQRTSAASILDALLDGLARTTENLPGRSHQRMGNEIMID